MKYQNLVNEMKKAKISKKMICDLLEIHRNSLFQKINGGHFTVEEALKIREHYFKTLSLEYLFARE